MGGNDSQNGEADIVPPTAWEQKERDALLASETSTRREKRQIAEDPNTTTEILADLCRSALKRETRKSRRLLFDAIAAHPNTAPTALVELLTLVPQTVRAFCSNPIAPLLLLENPGFVARMEESVQLAILQIASAPPSLVRLLTTGAQAKSEAVKEAALLHIALTDDVATWEESFDLLRRHLRAECFRQNANPYHWHHHADLVETGIAPTWAMDTPPANEPKPTPYFSYTLQEQRERAPDPGSSGEVSLIQRLDKKGRNRTVIEQALRADATLDDLRRLVRAPGVHPRLVSHVLLGKVGVPDAELLREMAKANDYYYRHILARHPETPTEVLTPILQDKNHLLRCLARRHPNAPPNARALSRDAFMRFGPSRVGEAVSPFVSFVACLHARSEPGDLTARGESRCWTTRLEAVLLARPTDAPLPGDPLGRTGLDLLNHLARDGNRLVRAAARTRLADPDFKFTWPEGEKNEKGE